MANNYLTKEWYEKLVQELHELKNEKLAEVIQRISEAREMGDLSENFDYKSALEDKDLVDNRIAEIERLIDNVEIISAKKHGKGDTTVDYGSTVIVKMEDGKEFTLTLVGSWEVSIEDGLHVSFDSPLGQAIKGKKEGETVTMRMSTGRQQVKIVAVKY